MEHQVGLPAGMTFATPPALRHPERTIRCVKVHQCKKRIARDLSRLSNFEFRRPLRQLEACWFSKSTFFFRRTLMSRDPSPYLNVSFNFHKEICEARDDGSREWDDFSVIKLALMKLWNQFINWLRGWKISYKFANHSLHQCIRARSATSEKYSYRNLLGKKISCHFLLLCFVVEV